MRRLLYCLIRAYQLLLGPLIGGGCRFTPSCSRYAAAVVLHNGTWRALQLIGWRLLRCQPWYSGPLHDPPPARRSRSRSDLFFGRCSRLPPLG